ncbi:amp-dependent synthetase and ligase [Nannochloropsis gaditana]|uniref:Amp-dependent synthetase and ligase n=1 Tax=Nannochloropsis gaditana TaxID=72520 RepID=W7TY86_9STRA|nr:amp-dependent synthetase and ligase [Nannochloropsis gaditana]
MEAALNILKEEGASLPLVVDIVDKHYLGKGKRLGEWEFEAFLQEGDEAFDLEGPEDEMAAISLSYTSGTTGDPKGVVTHHRGAYLNSLANIVSWGTGMPLHTVFLHVVPMFHCNGWCFPWAITALAGTHVCTRWVRADLLYEAMAKYNVSHFCGAPILMNLLLSASQEHKRDLLGRNIQLMTAGAPHLPR